MVDRPCEYPECKREGVRHLMSHYFCNKHRTKVVERAKELEEPPERFREWIESEVLAW